MSSATVCTSNITSGFIDLATYDELEKYLYGGPSATAYFVRETRKSTWFTLVPVVLSRSSGNGDFGTDHAVNISRAGDYLTAVWLRVSTPQITLGEQYASAGYRIRWTRNFMHNLIMDCCITFNDLSAARFDRNWSDLLILDISPTPVGSPPSTQCPLTYINGGVAPQLQLCQTWANYAIVSNDERKRMACAPRNILIEQVQTAPLQTFNPLTNTTPSYDLRFSHAIKVLFFACRNTTVVPEWSNYTSATPVPIAGMGSPTFTSVNFSPAGAVDPINTTSLTYESTARLSNMGSDYYSLVQPWYHAPVIPLETGYHMYSYSLDFICLDPKGSTNYGKLTNVSIAPVASQGAITAANGAGAALSGANFPNTYRFITTTINNNIIRISGGALGFPVL